MTKKNQFAQSRRMTLNRSQRAPLNSVCAARCILHPSDTEMEHFCMVVNSSRHLGEKSSEYYLTETLMESAMSLKTVPDYQVNS